MRLGGSGFEQMLAGVSGRKWEEAGASRKKQVQVGARG